MISKWYFIFYFRKLNSICSSKCCIFLLRILTFFYSLHFCHTAIKEHTIPIRIVSKMENVPACLPSTFNTKRNKRRAFKILGILLVWCTWIKFQLIYRRSEVARQTSTKKMDLSYIYRIICWFGFFPLLRSFFFLDHSCIVHNTQNWSLSFFYSIRMQHVCYKRFQFAYAFFSFCTNQTRNHRWEHIFLKHF